VALGISERTLWRMTKDREVPSLKIGRLVKYRPESLAACLVEMEQRGSRRAQATMGGSGE